MADPERPPETPPTTTPPPAAAPALTPEERDARTWAMVAWLTGFATLIVPLGNIIGPLAVWLLKKDEHPFVDDQGKESLNFQISTTIYAIGSAIAVLLLVGILLFVLVAVFWFVITIIGAVRSKDGDAYRAPLTIRFIR